jgi:secondary thiamine-phosphate synthase enzyme|tara:strand:+ start:267 stop:689 length:423 start_codon:yes stop_codon:yes gene_type:complete
MIQKFFNLELKTEGQRLYNFTDKTQKWVKDNNFSNGIINLSIQHTSASLIVQENADPDVQSDLLNYFDKLVPMNEKLYSHTTEGKDDMPAHIKSALTNNQISLSIKNSQILLGTWQGIYLFEHRLAPTKRIIIHHFIGEN